MPSAAALTFFHSTKVAFGGKNFFNSKGFRGELFSTTWVELERRKKLRKAKAAGRSGR